MKTSTLIGPALDWAVAKAEGALAPLGNLHAVGRDLFIGVGGDLGEPGQWVVYRPSTDWAQGGPIIEHQCISLKAESFHPREVDWEAEIWPNYNVPCSGRGRGPTALVAAMRCLVARKLGNEVEVPPQFPCNVSF